ncbi:MAG: carbohydrate binding family 9 domain-containing protein, partial [Cyclobacteriaceae bacterium]|nr:carbohydrate binding family 9 domain-containing protein [Cyclobacteriaceae bacterium]
QMARDFSWRSDDNVEIIISPFNDNRNGYLFVTNPNGAMADVWIGDEGEDFNKDWNGVWDVAVERNEKGWFAEMVIPFTTLKFKKENKQVWGINFERNIRRKKEQLLWQGWSRLYEIEKISQGGKLVGINNIKQGTKIEIKPYMLGGVEIVNNEIKTTTKIGGEVNIDITPTLKLNFSANTDFAQVEADNQVVNLSRFSLFFPEKRRFFLERASTFDFQYDLNNNLFYSRRIGIEDGELIPLYGGARLVGRLNKWDVGFLNMQSREKDDFPSENFGVLRLRRNIFNQRSYAGVMFTSRIGTDGHRNFAYGLDGIINLFKQDYLQINVAQTQDTNDTTGISAMDRSRIYLMWENRIINGFGYRFSYSNVGANYNPGVGFEQRFNFSQFGDQLFYSWFAPEESSLRQTTITLNGSVSLNNSSNQLETYLGGLSSSWIWNRNAQLTIGLEDFFDDVPNEFSLSDDIKITPGAYSNISGSVWYSTPAVNFIKLEMIGKIGSFYDGELSSISLAPEIVFSKYFRLATFYQFAYIDFKDMNKKFQSHLARLNMARSVNVKLSASAFIQFNTLDEISAINFRLRYAPVDGNDLYFVYNEILNTNPMSEIPHLPASDNRAIILKYIHTLKL